MFTLYLYIVHMLYKLRVFVVKSVKFFFSFATAFQSGE